MITLAQPLDAAPLPVLLLAIITGEARVTEGPMAIKLDALFDALSETKEQRQRYEQARQRLEQEICGLAAGLTSIQDRAEVLSYLYWKCEDIQVSRLYEIFRVSFHDGHIRPQQKTLPCRYCGQSTPVLFASREALKRSDGMGTCGQCQYQIDMAQEAKDRAREEARERQREAMRAIYDDSGLSGWDCYFFEDLLMVFRQQDELRKSAVYIGERRGRSADEIQRWLRSLERKGRTYAFSSRERQDVQSRFRMSTVVAHASRNGGKSSVTEQTNHGIA